MAPTLYPAGLSELDFVETYLHSALRKPQIAADAALRTLVLASATDRVMLTALISEQLAEACRRLVAVHDALSDRTYPIARSLLAPLPGAASWQRFIHWAAVTPPDQMVRDLNVGEGGLESARKLRGQPDLGMFTPLVEASESATLAFLIPSPEVKRTPVSFWVSGKDGEGTPISVLFGAEEGDSAALADMTADLIEISRGFLGAYLDARRGAGRR